MAKVTYNYFTKVFNINDRTRPAWDANIKRWLLADFLATKWSKETTVARLLQYYESLPMNTNGVIEALERRHIISWENILNIYEVFINLRVNPKNKKVNTATMEAFGNVIYYLLGSFKFTPFNNSLVDPIEAGNIPRLLAIFNDQFSALNSSRNNLFIGPARQNRSIGQAHDTGGDLPKQILQGRPFGNTVSNAIAVINGHFEANGKPKIGQL